MLTTISNRLPPVYIDRKEEHHADCPFCGKPAKIGQRHFSYSKRGYICFVCGESGGLIKLSKHLNIENYTPPPLPPKRTQKDAHWRQWSITDYLIRFGANYEIWGNYKPLSKETQDRYYLRYGIVPNSKKCRHNRLVVPIVDNDGKLAIIRARRNGCGCEAKWLVAGGSRLANTPLFNSREIVPGCVVLICENVIDAIMVQLNTESIYHLVSPQLTADACRKLAALPNNHFVGVATMSVSYWQAEWVEPLRQASLAIVAYDHDIPGNGGGKHRAALMKSWKGPKDSEMGGVKLVNRLLKERIPAVLLDWGNHPPKYDIGDYLKGD